jgi:plasmid stabilization system protein ParE
MRYKHVYTPAALRDYTESVSWYALRSIRAAENFIAEVTEKIKIICNSPGKFKNRYKNFRETSLKRFPFYIIYFTDDANKTVIITAVYHHKRNPRNKYSK